ncbi:MAG: hypothetical protein JW837_12420 [Sedimentisphaerales bacterium]|nr:hypothetical protein [Sedimentisphaerales bacterium]
MTFRINKANGMTTIKKAIILRKESEARAKAEERLREVRGTRTAVEQKTAAQVERKLHAQQLRFGDLIKKIEAQVNVEISNANAQLQEFLDKVSSYKAEAEQKKEMLSKAQEKLKTETTAKIKAYEILRKEKRQRRKDQAKLTGDITEAEARTAVRSVRLREQTRVLRADIINDYRLSYQTCAHPRDLKRKVALLSALTIISAVILVLIAVKYPFASESGHELTGKPASATAIIGGDITGVRPTGEQTAGLLHGSTGGPLTSTSKPVLKIKSSDEAGLKVKEEKNVITSENQATAKKERTFPDIITSANSHIVQSSNNDRWETSIGSHVSYAFSEVFVPTEATIKSVVVFIEHFEEERFIEGKLEWSVGTGWPHKPEVWAAIKAPIHRGESNENVDTWDVTEAVDTAEKIKALQLHVKNNSHSYKSKTLMDYAYVVVEYD